MNLSLWAKLLPLEQVNAHQYVLQISANKSIKSVHADMNRLQGEKLYYQKSGGLYRLYIVNIPTYKMAQSTKQRIRKVVQGTLIKKGLPNLPKQHRHAPTPTNAPTHWHVMIEYDLKVKESPNPHAPTLYRLYRGEEIDIQPIGQTWAQVVGKGGYIPLHIESNAANRAIHNSPIDPQLRARYEEALAYFRSGDISVAYERFNALFQEVPDDNNINFYLGQSAFHLGDYDTASLAFNRILIKEPDANRTKLELARVYAKQRKYKEAKQLLHEARTHAPAEVRADIDRFLYHLDHIETRHFYKGSVSVGAYYDSNLYNRPDDEQFNIPALDDLALTNATEDTDALGHEERATLNHRYKINERTFFKNDLLALHRAFPSHNQTNIGFVSYAPALSMAYGNCMIDYAIFGDQLWYGGERYVRSYGVNPRLNYKLSDELFINTALKYQKKSYHDNTLRNSRILEGSVGATQVRSSTLSNRAQLVVSDEEKDHGTLTSVDKQSIKASLSSTKKLNDALSFTPTVSLKGVRYDDQDSYYLTNRRDYELKAGINTSYALEDGYSLNGSYNFTNNSSNVEYAKYKKHAASLNLKKSF
jgi:Tfp pilus assembly protein PilF